MISIDFANDSRLPDRMQTMNEAGEGGRSGRWLRREQRRRSQRQRLAKHGASLRRVYLDAVRKRLQKKKSA
jgi:hypothetical protein